MTHGVVLNLQTQIAELVWYCAVGPQLPGPELLFLKVNLSSKNSLEYFAAGFELLDASAAMPHRITCCKENFTEHQLHASAQQEDKPSNICRSMVFILYVVIPVTLIAPAGHVVPWFHRTLHCRCRLWSCQAAYGKRLIMAAGHSCRYHIRLLLAGAYHTLPPFCTKLHFIHRAEREAERSST